MFKKITIYSTLFFFTVLCYLFFWPVPIEPKILNLPIPPKIDGIYKPNNELTDLIKIKTGNGPESIAIDEKGNFYTGLSSNEIVRFNIKDQKPVSILNTFGRPLGLKWDKYSNRLLIADEQKGILAIDSFDNSTVILDKLNAGDNEIFSVNSIDVSSEGIIYFTVSSTRNNLISNETVYNEKELWKSNPSGQLISYNTLTKQIKIELKDLNFANGLVLSNDESYILFADTKSRSLKNII